MMFRPRPPIGLHFATTTTHHTPPTARHTLRYSHSPLPSVHRAPSTSDLWVPLLSTESQSFVILLSLASFASRAHPQLHQPPNFRTLHLLAPRPTRTTFATVISSKRFQFRCPSKRYPHTHRDLVYQIATSAKSVEKHAFAAAKSVI